MTRLPTDALEVSLEDLAADGWPDERQTARLTEAQLADHWDISQRTLQRWRAAGQGPAWIRIGKKVIYRRADIHAFEVSQVQYAGGNGGQG